MHIGIHAVPAFKENPTGVEVYAREIITRMLRLINDDSGKNEHRVTLYTDEEPKSPIVGAATKVLKSPLLWTQIRLSIEMARHAPDLLFTPANALPRDLPKKSVTTLHGIEFLQSPWHYSFKQRYYLNVLTRDAIKRASRLIVVSHATAAALEEYLGVPYERMSVIPHGAPKMPDDIEPENRDKPYFLYVGRLETHKNILGLIEAFNIFRKTHPDSEHELLLAGGGGFRHEKISNAISESKYRSSILELGYVSEERKWGLLRAADAFCFPSFSEGFGLPILEAQVAGVPVVTSNVTAMPEVAGNKSAILVDPKVSEQIAEAMASVVFEPSLRKKLISRGTENAKRFSWDKTARETLALLLSV